jgi:DNA polymerase-3 subunit delta
MSKIMIILIYGLDTYRSGQKLKEIIERYKKIHKSGLSLKFFDLKEKNFDDFKNEFQSVSMFKEKKLIVLKNANSNKEFKEQFLEKIKDFSSSKEIIIFFEEGEISKGDNFFQEIKKVAKFQEFKPLNEFRLKFWIEEEVKKYNSKIEEKAINKLIEFVGNDLWQIENEIKKLVAFKKDGEINQRDIENLVAPNLETNIFKTIDFIAKKDKKNALKSLKSHLEKGEKVSYIFSMIKFEFRNLLMIKDLVEKRIPIQNIQKQTNLHSFVIEKCLPLAKRFQLEELKKIYQKIFELDLAMKNGKIEPEIALTLFISQI